MEAKTLAGRYQLERRIGSGGMGAVWKARDNVLGRDVAVKCLHDSYAADASFAERFRREARSAARLTHPNIVAVFDTGEQDGVPFIVQELVEGESLYARLQTEGPLPVAEAARITRDVLGALGHAHSRGLVHRDMKPANVLLEDATGHVKVADFGIAKGLEDSGGLTKTGGLIGTAAYLAPEQISGAEATPASDLYAVGCLVYACLTGDAPFTGPSPVAIAMRHLNDAVPPVSVRRPDVPQQVSMVVAKALEKDPARRFSTADEMASALMDSGAHRVTSTLPVVVEPAPTQVVGGTAPLPQRDQTVRLESAQRSRRPRGSRVLAVLTFLLVAAAATALVATYLENRETGRTLEEPLFTPAPDVVDEADTSPSSTATATPTPTPTVEPTPAPTEQPGLDLPGFGGGIRGDQDETPQPRGERTPRGDRPSDD